MAENTANIKGNWEKYPKYIKLKEGNDILIYQ
jgi:hypothetical protein